MLMSMLRTYEHIHLNSDMLQVITSGHTAHNQSTHSSNSAQQTVICSETLREPSIGFVIVLSASD